MNQIDELFKRASLRQIREFLLSGLEDTETNYESYSEKLKRSREPVFSRLEQVYSDPIELDIATADLLTVLTAYESVFMEIGMKTGARLVFELLTSNTIKFM